MTLELIADDLRPGTVGFSGLCLLIYVLIASGLTYVLFREDKRRALVGAERIPEARLLAMSALCGWPGAKLAQIRFRHKTRKEPFGTVLNLIAAGQMVVLVAHSTPVHQGTVMMAAWASDVAAEMQAVALDLGAPSSAEG